MQNNYYLETTMKVTRKIIAGLGILVLTTGSPIGDPAKAQEYPFQKGFQQGFGWGGTPAKAGGLTNWNLTGYSTSEPTQSDAKVPDDWRTVRLAIVDFYKKGFERIKVEPPPSETEIENIIQIDLKIQKEYLQATLGLKYLGITI